MDFLLFFKRVMICKDDVPLCGILQTLSTVTLIRFDLSNKTNAKGTKVAEWMMMKMMMMKAAVDLLCWCCSGTKSLLNSSAVGPVA